MIWFIFFFALMIPLAAVVLDSQLGRALAALVERWGRSGGEGPGEHRIAALEAEVERLALELRRVEEQTDFLQHLLSERSGIGGALEPGERGE
jgi:hypothetical protein